MTTKSVIAGAGRVGAHIARELIKFGQDVVVIESDPGHAEAAGDTLDATIINANVVETAALRKAGLADADAFIAVTESDEVNLAACLLARKMGARRRIARVRNEDWFSPAMLDAAEMGIDTVIHPEQETVRFIERVMSLEGAFDFADLADGEVELIGFHVDPALPIVGHSMAELKEMFALGYFLIVGMYRKGEFIVPGGADKVEGGDRIWILTVKDTESMVLPVFMRRKPSGENAVIIHGATRIGLRLAGQLAAAGRRVTVIERDPELARIASESLEGATVLKFDPGEEMDVLRETRVGSAGWFIAATAESKDNIVTGLLAKSAGVRRVAVITDESSYMPVMDQIGLDVVVNPYILTAGAILTSLRRGIVHSVVKLRAGEAELIEYRVAARSPIANKTLARAGLPKGALVGLVMRGGAIMIPDGAMALEEGDRALVVATPATLPVVDSLFAARGVFA